MSSLYDANLASSTLIEQYRSQGLTELQIALQLALDNINAQLLKTNGVYTKAQLNALQKLIKDEITASYGGLFETIQEESLAIATINYQTMLGTASVTLNKTAIDNILNGKKLINTVNNPNTKTVESKTFKELFSDQITYHESKLRAVLAGGVAQNLTPQQIARVLTDRNSKLYSGAVTATRTAVFDARNEGVYDSYRELERTGLVRYYEHVSVLDGGTSPICVSLDGRKYYVKFEEIPPANRPGLHFNCRSQLVARTEEDSGLRVSQDGQIPREKYPEWFDRQPATFQRQVLGNKKYEQYKAGNLKFRSLPDVVGNKSISLEQYRERLFDYVGIEN